MRSLIKIAAFALLLSFWGNALAFSGVFDEKNKPGDDKKTKTKRDDTTHYTLNEENLVEGNDTALINFPSNDLYATWDTAIIHPYNFADCFRADSVLLNLTEAGDGGFVMPRKGIITSQFGWRRYRPHYGTDIDLDKGDTVVSAFDGMIRIAKSHVQGYGNVVIIRHKNGLETVYGHLSKLLVDAGQTVKAGETIGLGGNTGRSYGAHLHFEMRYLGQALDTEDFIDFANGTLKANDFVLRKSDVETKYDLRALHSRHKRDIGLSGYGGKGAMAKNGIYRVRPGDTLGAIAKRHHTTVKAICAKNKFKPTKVLQVGQKIKI